MRMREREREREPLLRECPDAVECEVLLFECVLPLRCAFEVFTGDK